MVAWRWEVLRAADPRQFPAEAHAKTMLSGPEVGSWGNPPSLASGGMFAL